MKKIYFAIVEDTEGAMHRKIGQTKFDNVKKRFSDKRFYNSCKIIKSIEVPNHAIGHVEHQFKDMQVGKRWKEYDIPPHFMGRTEVIKPHFTDEEILSRFEKIKDLPKQITLEDF